MRLKPMKQFLVDHVCEPHPDVRTVQRWPGAVKLGARWYIDLDEWVQHFTPSIEVRLLEKDPALAALLDAVS